MRRLLGNLVFAASATVVVACGSGGGVSPGSIVDASGGGAPLSGTQNPSSLAYPPVIIDDGLLSTGQYAGVNVTLTDAQSATDAGVDTYVAQATPPPQQPPADPAGSHLLTFSTTVPTSQQIVRYYHQVPLVFTSTQAGVRTSTTYSAIAFYLSANVPGATQATPSLEIYGGNAPTQYDVRVGCVQDVDPGSGNQPALVNTFGSQNPVGHRYTCPLPAYGAPSGSYLTSVSKIPTAVSTYQGPGIANAALPNVTGAFTPALLTAAGAATPSPVAPGQTTSPLLPTIELVLDEGANPPLAASTGNTISIDYMYAEPVPI